MERDFIQEIADDYEAKKKELIEKSSEEFGNYVEGRLRDFIDGYYRAHGWNTQEEADKKIEETKESLYEKSIQDKDNTKKQEVKGETYKSKLSDILKKLGIAASVIIVVAIAIKAKIKSDDENLLFQYKIIREQEAQEKKLLTSEMKELREVDKDMLDELKEGIKEYKDKHKSEYTASGRRLDGSKGQYTNSFSFELYETSDIYLDALEDMADKEVQAKYHERPVVSSMEEHVMPQREINLLLKPGYPIEEVEDTETLKK